MAKAFKFQKAQEEIESILGKIESGDVDLDQLASHVARATELIKQCKEKIEATELQVKEVLEKA